MAGDRVNVGTARFWILAGAPPMLLEPTNDVMKASTAAGHPALDVIDRGPFNQWTGKPHTPDPRYEAIKAIERIEEGGRHGEERARRLAALDLDEDARHAL